MPDRRTAPHQADGVHQAGDAATLENVSAKLDALLERLSTPAAQPRFLGVDAAAERAGISAESIRSLLAAGKLTALRPVRGRVVIDVAELDSYVLGSRNAIRHGRGSVNRSRREAPSD